MIQRVREWLGPEGIELFKDYKAKYKTVSPVFVDNGIPHPVYFIEGMQVRNFLRTLEECKDWTDHDFDNQWAKIINQAIEE
jgi:hypothetical protein